MINNVIIVAGGKGLRIGGELPKQFLVVAGKPVLMRTIDAFYKFDLQVNIVVVLPTHFQNYWQDICHKFNFKTPHTVADGGETRFHSVKNGLEFVKEGLVAVHDGARPFVSVDLISKIFQLGNIYEAVVPVTDTTDSLREIMGENRSKIINRSVIKQVQTPQLFHSNVLKDAYKTEYCDTFTDDASVVESTGINIHLTQGELTNIKITTPFDLEIANLIANKHD